jgi:hypothetical protein
MATSTSIKFGRPRKNEVLAYAVIPHKDAAGEHLRDKHVHAGVFDQNPEYRQIIESERARDLRELSRRSESGSTQSTAIPRS